MAGTYWALISAADLVPVLNESLVSLLASANVGLWIDEIQIDIDPQTANDQFTLEVHTTSSLGTGSALTPGKINQGDDENLQFTAAEQAFTAEPTKVALIDRRKIYINGSSILRTIWRFGNPRLKIPAGKGLNIYYPNAVVTPTFTVKILGEE